MVKDSISVIISSLIFFAVFCFGIDYVFPDPNTNPHFKVGDCIYLPGKEKWSKVFIYKIQEIGEHNYKVATRIGKWWYVDQSDLDNIPFRLDSELVKVECPR